MGFSVKRQWVDFPRRFVPANTTAANSSLAYAGLYHGTDRDSVSQQPPVVYEGDRPVIDGLTQTGNSLIAIERPSKTLYQKGTIFLSFTPNGIAPAAYAKLFVTTDNEFQLYRAANDSWLQFKIGNSGPSIKVSQIWGQPSTRHIAVSWDTSVDYIMLMVDGVVYRESNSANFSPVPDDSLDIRLLNRSSRNRQAEGKVGYFLLYDEVLDVAAARAISRAPWLVLEPRTVWIPVASGAGVYNAQVTFEGAKGIQKFESVSSQGFVLFSSLNQKDIVSDALLSGSSQFVALSGDSFSSGVDISPVVNMSRNLQCDSYADLLTDYSLALGTVKRTDLETTNSVFEGAFSLSLLGGISHDSTAQTGVIESSLLFTTNISTTNQSNGSLVATTSLSVNIDLQPDAYSNIVNRLALAMASGVYQAAEIGIDGGVTFLVDSVFDHSLNVVLGGEIPLNSIIGLNIVADAVLSAGFSLAAVKSVSVNATKITIGIEVAPHRIFNVEIDSRLIDIGEDDRVNEIPH